MRVFVIIYFVFRLDSQSVPNFVFAVGQQRSEGPLYKKTIEKTIQTVLEATVDEKAASIVYTPRKAPTGLSSTFEKIYQTKTYVDRILASVSSRPSGHADSFPKQALEIAGAEITKQKSNRRKTILLILNEEPDASLNEQVKALRANNIFVSVVALGDRLDERRLKKKLPDVSILYVVNDDDDLDKIIDEIKKSKLTSK